MAKENKDACDVRVIHEDRVEKAHKFDLKTEEMGTLMPIFKALSDANRLRILHALLHQEMCVCDLAAFLGSSESAVSHQLRNLRQTGLVENRREGTVLYYTLTSGKLRELITTACHQIHQD
ncbi:MAG: metalloregulator ArsR/SmtB family transcription factor [Desulforhopalus sp.]|nr:metalloregulator ArsR/SmtB family transcription factor [Desulforhopalus sp.]